MLYTVIRHSVLSMSKPKDEEIDIIDVSEELQHGVTLQQIRRNYVYQRTEMNYNGYNMGSRKVPYARAWFKTTEKPMDSKMTPDPYYAIIDVDHIPLNGNRAAAIKTELKKYFDRDMQIISDSELNKATYGILEAVNPIMNDRAADATHRPQHAGYYSPNLRVRHALFTEVYDVDDYLEHHGVKGMRWGVINEDDKKIGQRLSASIRRHGQHAGYYNPNVGSSSSATSQGGDKTGSSTSSGNNGRVSSKANKNLSSPRYSSVVMSPSVKDKQYENKFDLNAGGTAGRDGIEYYFKEGSKTYKIEFPRSEIEKYKTLEEARNAIPNIIYEYCKANNIYLTEKMFEAMVYKMSNQFSAAYEDFGNYHPISGHS